MADEPSLVPQWLISGKGAPSAGAKPTSSSASSFASNSGVPAKDASRRPKLQTTSNSRIGFGRQPVREPLRRSSTANERSSRDSWSSGPVTPALPAGLARAAGRAPRSPTSHGSFENSGREDYLLSPRQRSVFRTISGPPHVLDREELGFGAELGPSAEDWGRGSKGGLDHDAAAASRGSSSNASQHPRSWLLSQGPASSPAAAAGGRRAVDGPWTSRLADVAQDSLAPPLAASAVSPRSTGTASSHRDAGSPGPRGASLSPRAQEFDASVLAPTKQHQQQQQPPLLGHTASSDTGSVVSSDAVAVGTSAAPPSPMPRMVDALQQAVTPPPAQQGALERSRLEQLAMRQSKQLIPVLPSQRDKGKAKHAAGPGAASKPLAAGPAADVLNRARSLPSPPQPKRVEDAAGMTGLGPAPIRKAAPTAAAAPMQEAKPQASGQPKPSDRERQRLSFFQSLRKSSNGGTGSAAAAVQPASNGEAAAAADEHADQARPAEQQNELQHVVKQQLPEASSQEPASSSSSMPLGSIAEGGEQPQSAGAQAERSVAQTLVEQERQEEPAQDCVPSNAFDTSDPRLRVSAEEEAFLRSLGWTEGGDDEDEGLTEEEIASFKANTQQQQPQQQRPLLQGSAPSFGKQPPRAATLPAFTPPHPDPALTFTEQQPYWQPPQHMHGHVNGFHPYQQSAAYPHFYYNGGRQHSWQ